MLHCWTALACSTDIKFPLATIFSLTPYSYNVICCIMKEFKPVSVKTIFLGRTGKSVIHTPLAVSSASSCSSQPSEGSSSLSEAALEVNDQNVPMFSSGEFQQSAAHRRSYSLVFNWEKICEKLLVRVVAEESLPEKCLCVFSKEQELTARCWYCGLKQFFCSTCTHDLHVERNQFHVLEQWKVFCI